MRARLISWAMILLSALAVLVMVHAIAPEKPCRKPIRYRIASVDPRFHLGATEVASAARQAAAVWNQPLGRDLIREDPRGEIAVQLVYDYRQAATDKLRRIGGAIDNSEATYTSLKNTLAAVRADFEPRQASLKSDIDNYNSRAQALKAEVESGNRRGGVSDADFNRIQAERTELVFLQKSLDEREQALRDEADTINSLVDAINGIATSLNLAVVDYNQTGRPLQQEFNEANYVRKNGRQGITVYRVTTLRGLVRVLAHEFGHALGLGHNGNPKSLMYRVNQAQETVLSAEDVVSLQNRCNGE